MQSSVKDVKTLALGQCALRPLLCDLQLFVDNYGNVTLMV